MRSNFRVVIISLACICTGGASVAADALPVWAYGVPTAAAGNSPATPTGRVGQTPQTAPDNASLKRLPGSSGAFTLPQIRDGFGPADWYPADHPQMPDIVAHGRRPDVRACALCHYPNGKGRAENAPIAGYPTAYFIQQMADFKKGARKSGSRGRPTRTS